MKRARPSRRSAIQNVWMATRTIGITACAVWSFSQELSQSFFARRELSPCRSAEAGRLSHLPGLPNRAPQWAQSKTDEEAKPLNRQLSLRPSGIWCGGPESNRHGPCGPRDFKSLASTNSATPADFFNRMITQLTVDRLLPLSEPL